MSNVLKFKVGKVNILWTPGKKIKNSWRILAKQGQLIEFRSNKIRTAEELFRAKTKEYSELHKLIHEILNSIIKQLTWQQYNKYSRLKGSNLSFISAFEALKQTTKNKNLLVQIARGYDLSLQLQALRYEVNKARECLYSQVG